MKILRNIFLLLLVVVIVLGAAAFFIYNNWTRGPLPQHDGTITVAGLNDTVEVIRDEWGVPHIYASNPYDLFFAQGYTQAQDRWWQMEFFRHIGSGAIQELTGRSSALLGTDIFIRTVGWRRAAERDFEMMDPAIRDHLLAFTDGVNAYISSRDAGQLALEYNVLGLTGVNIEVEPWDPVDTIVWTKVMANDLSGNRSTELLLSELMAELPEDMVMDYAPMFPFDEKPTIIQPQDLPVSDETLRNPDAQTAQINALENSAGLRGLNASWAGSSEAMGLAFGSGDGIGSNNWVAGGDKTASGMPLLANDPHLGIQMPSIWYEIGLHCQPVSDDCPFDVVGFTFSPSPGIVIGHNGNIAWGVTNVGWDTQDLYRMEINPEDDFQYRWNDEWRDMTTYEEVIRFGNSDDTLIITVRETHLGPIVNDHQIDDDGNLMGFNNDDPLAFKWTATAEQGTIVESLFGLMTAQDWEDFRAALALWDSPSQNVVYADMEGNIGYQTPGRVPVRAPGHTGLLPVDGTTDEYEWRGYVPFDSLPRVLNPERGYIATANQALVPPEYYDQLSEELADEYGEDAHYAFGYYWAYGYRGQRIVELLEATDEHTVETFQAIQGDNKMLVAETMAPYLSALDFADDDLTDLRDWLLDWDYQMHKDSPQAALFAAFWAELNLLLYEDQLGDMTTPNGGSQQMWTTTVLANEPDNIWWDNVETEDITESRDDILQQAFIEGRDTAVRLMGEDRNTWAWGDLHTATFTSNPLGLSGIDLIENIVNVGPVPTSGGSGIVNATGWNVASRSFEVRGLPSMRMIIDMGDLTNSYTIHTTGQSGHPASPHYGNMVEPWANIEHKPMLWTRDQVEGAAANTLTLQPQ